MFRLKLDFSKLFQEWFSMLVSDTFNIRLREDFTPVIEHQDYEIDYSYLSGGERRICCDVFLTCYTINLSNI